MRCDLCGAKGKWKDVIKKAGRFSVLVCKDCLVDYNKGKKHYHKIIKRLKHNNPELLELI